MSDEETKPSGKMTDGQLLSLIGAYERASLGSSVAAGATISTTVYPSNQTMTTLEIDRYNAINMYYARPLGNEVENRSQVVLPELRDTIEWLMPQLMRMFMSSKEICRFEPETPEDEDQAEMETAVVNHVFMKENNGFFVLHDFFKDALLLRNGYANVYFKEEEHTGVERYSGLTQQELIKLLSDMSDEDTEILEQREYTIDVPVMAPVPGAMPDPTLPVAKIPVFDINIRRTETKGRVCVECLPPEEVYVSPRARESLEGIPFVMHKTETPRSELIADGFDRAIVDALPTGRPDWLEMVSLARNEVVDQLSVENPSDKAMQTVEVRTVTMMVDFDGDGIAELRRVFVAGDKILENEEIEEVPMASCAPIRMPHRHTGLSYYDLIADLQVIKTTLFRQGLDNLYLANNSRVGVDWKNCSIDDLLTSRPGGVVRTNGPPSSVLMPLEQTSNIMEQVLPTMDYVDKMKSNRTGLGPNMAGLDVDELQNVTKGGQLAAMSAASLKIELVARMLAEGVKEIFTKIHGALMRHQDEPLQFELSGKWVNVDPSSWRRRTKVNVNVGLGSGSREELRTNLMMLGQAQAQLAPLGLIGPKQAYATFKQVAESLGFNQPEQFAMDPDSPEYQQHLASMPPHQPDPSIQVAQIRAQTAQQVAQSAQQTEIMKLQGQLAKAQDELQAEQEKHGKELQQQQQQSDADREHDALSTHADYKTAQANNNAAMDQTIVKALAGIIAQQLKGQQANAGQVLDQDFQTARAGIEGGAGNAQPDADPMHEMMGNLHQAIQHLGRPRTATLSDGRQIRID